MAKANDARPFGITLLMVFGFFAGLMNIAAGIFLILDRNDPQLVLQTLHSPSQLLTAGIVAIVFGSIQLLLASALGAANNIVRLVYAFIAALNFSMGVWATVALSSEQRAAGVLTMVFSGLILYFLFNQKADDYFGTN